MEGRSMILLPDTMRVALLVNGARHIAAQRDGLPDPDPVPLLKLFNPCGSATWLATELDEDGDTLFGLADLGFGCPELGSFSLSEIAAVRLPLICGSSAISISPAPTRCRSGRRLPAIGSISQAEIALRLTGF
jgi:hypothetical protein